MRASIAKIGRVTLKRAPGMGVLCRQPGTPAAEHLNSTLRYEARYNRHNMAGYALVTWGRDMAYSSHFHTSDSPFGGTAMASFVHDALLRDWIDLQA